MGIKILLSAVKNKITADYSEDVFHISFKQSKILDTIYALTKVLNRKNDYEGVELKVEGSRKALAKIRQIIDK